VKTRIIVALTALAVSVGVSTADAPEQSAEGFVKSIRKSDN